MSGSSRSKSSRATEPPADAGDAKRFTWSAGDVRVDNSQATGEPFDLLAKRKPSAEPKAS